MKSSTLHITLLLVIIFSIVIAAQGHAQTDRELEEYVVVARRNAADIGVQATSFDSTALKENISLSMADVLAYRSAVYVKNYGRATLSTVAFRGTSPSHTQVTWNGMRINSPMLGMTDFSMIPSFFVDRATMLHGTASVNETGGGIGGLVKLSTAPARRRGWHGEYIQGIGSFETFDEFARLSYSSAHWHTSLRAALASSKNNYKYINHDKAVNIYDENHQIVGRYHPTERNDNGEFRDFHVMEDTYYDSPAGDHVSLCAWYMNSWRQLPLLTVDYGDTRQYENEQRESTLRASAGWNRMFGRWKLDAGAGCTYTTLNYDYRRAAGNGEEMADMTRSRSRVHTAMGRFGALWNPSERWRVSADIQLYQQHVESRDRNTLAWDNDRPVIGFRASQTEVSASASARWEPSRRLGLAATVRQEIRGNQTAAPIPAIYTDLLLWDAANLTIKASASRNYKFPTLNDRYFLPGGNPDLRPEKGMTYDAGLSFALPAEMPLAVSGSATWFDSRIEDWILWLPTVKGFFSPRNIAKVHAYGVESKLAVSAELGKRWQISGDASYSWTPSINRSRPVSEADRSVGKQLPYVPRHSASAVGNLSWRRWSFSYKWNYYSTRYTMTSNEQTLTGRLPDYYMSNISLEKEIPLRKVTLQVKGTLNNIFNEDYLSVLSRPMPGINGEIYIGIKF